MPISIARRLATVLGTTVVAGGVLSGFAAAASAAPGDPPPSRDRVIQPFRTADLLVPTSGRSGARVVSQPRIGKAQDTPESQVWAFDNSRKFDQNGAVIRGGVSFIFQPTLGRSGVRPLCMDVAGDSAQAGASVELRLCDGTPSQVFTFVGDLQVPNVQNVRSGLNLEVQPDGTVVQRGFVGRAPAGASAQERAKLQARRDAQTFLPRPKSLGVGGA
ncbi:RICIN domain-containing protein [Micromonospora auratinigra]|uniref:Ricin-type beta-trefoil lectin domain n=1 Tax=Micromonospora auratinigra TaxID=261654 RepID=A0A1A8Z4T6_9ACTN|nr:RICIN domain-containing protein [Micromonospora auratinigra]SBT38793.1 Ricin-type beta-trefoil lectin domain [Micromonospora auratinigra]